jgi:hypothetical protein
LSKVDNSSSIAGKNGADMGWKDTGTRFKQKNGADMGWKDTGT